jgi:prepilin-type N-terminal cleavage/methylation domain-containing protein
MKKTHICSASGFTLIEILIAIVILGIVGLAIFSVQVQSIRTAARSASLTEAAALASQELERFQTVAMGDLFSGLSQPYRTMERLGVFPPTAESGWDGEKEVGDPHGKRRYRVYWNVAPGAPGTDMEGRAMVRLEVQWEDYGQLRRLQFDLLKTDVM